MEHKYDQKLSGIKKERIPIRRSDLNFFVSILWCAFWLLLFDWEYLAESSLYLNIYLISEYVFYLNIHILFPYKYFFFISSICSFYLNIAIKKQPEPILTKWGRSFNCIVFLRYKKESITVWCSMTCLVRCSIIFVNGYLVRYCNIADKWCNFSVPVIEIPDRKTENNQREWIKETVNLC